MKNLFLLFLLLVFTISLEAQNIKRRGFIGVKAIELSDSISMINNDIKGVFVSDVVANSSAQNAGLIKGDILFEINKKSITNVAEYKSSISGIRESDKVDFYVMRDKNILILSSIAPVLPYEKSDDYEIIYDEVKFQNGFIRLIINKPKGEGKFKSIFFIPGYMCYSLDNIGKHPYGQLVDGLCKKGYVVMRAEKLGMGDCINTPNCFDVNYMTELEGFETGYEKLKSYSFVDTTNMFVFGHSLGGYEAPMVAEKLGAKGVIVCGTGYKTWYEYIIEMFRFQNIIAGADYIENEKLIQTMIPLLYDYLILKKTPTELNTNEKYSSVLKEYLEYDGGEKIWSRHYTYWQQLQDLNMPEIWKNLNSEVLIIRGEGDFEAFSNSDHQSIADAVNFYHRGKAKFVLIPNMDHGFATATDPADSYRKKQIPGFYYNNFNPAIFDVVEKWINELK